MKLTAADLGIGRLERRARWAHVLLHVEAEKPDEHELLAELAQNGARATIERCAPGGGLALDVRIDPGAGSNDATPEALLMLGESTGSVRSVGTDEGDIVVAMAAAAMRWLPIEAVREMFVPAPRMPALVWEDAQGEPRVALAWAMETPTLLADPETGFIRSPAMRESRLAACTAILKAAHGEQDALSLMFPHSLFGLADELRAAGIIGGDVCRLALAAFRGGSVARNS